MPRHVHSPSLSTAYAFRQAPKKQDKDLSQASDASGKMVVSKRPSDVDHEASRNRIEWLASLDTESRPGRNYRRTTIICTIGPKTNSVEKINMLRTAGLNVVRMNFSHGSYEVYDHLGTEMCL